MALINQLPPEVLTSIFGRTINTAYDPLNARPAVSLTLTLCSVCSHWRRIVIGNVSLWTYVPIGDSKTAGDLTRLCLERSQDSPLIDIVASAQSSTQTCWQAMDELKQNINRIRSLSVVAFLSLQLDDLLSFMLKDQVPPSLIHLSLASNPRDSFLLTLELESSHCKAHFAQLCNQLQTLEMSDACTDFKPYTSTFSQLEKFGLNFHLGFPSTLWDLLPIAPKLRILDISDRWRAGERIDPEVAHGVKVLRLRQPNPFYRWEQQGDLASRDWDVIDFQLPRHIGYLTAGTKDELISDIENLISYMRTKSSKITLLTLRNDQIEVLGRINDMFQVLPNLHTLTFDSLDLTESTLSFFIPPPNSSEPFPRFRTLRLLSSKVLHVETLKSLISSYPIQRLDLWRSTLDWGDGTVGGSYRPMGSSPFYGWLCERVPELYISEP